MLTKRTARTIREKQDELDALRREVEALKAVSLLKLGTQYALDFVASGDVTMLREELEHCITEDACLALEIEEGYASGLIDEAVNAQELYLREGEVFIPAHTLRAAKVIV